MADPIAEAAMNNPAEMAKPMMSIIPITIIVKPKTDPNICSTTSFEKSPITPPPDTIIITPKTVATMKIVSEIAAAIFIPSFL